MPGRSAANSALVTAAGFHPFQFRTTEVKPATADGTVWETAWESRSLPALLPRPETRCLGPFLFQAATARRAVSHADYRRRSRPRAATRALRNATVWGNGQGE